MKTKKLIVFSDLHAGNKHVKDSDIDYLISTIVRLADSETALVFTGDLFHMRVSIDSSAAKQVFKLLSVINQLELPAVFINGTRSHDYDYMESFLSNLDSDVSVLFPTIQFISKRKEVMLNELQVLCLPEEYIDDEVEDYYPELFDESSRYDLVLFHGTLSDVASYNEHIESVPFKKAPILNKKMLWNASKIVLCGHIHKEQEYTDEKGNYLSYIGSYCDMEHNNSKSDKGLRLLTVDRNEDGELFVEKAEQLLNLSSSKFITFNMYYFKDKDGNSRIDIINDDEKIAEFDITLEADLKKFRDEFMTAYLNKGYYVRFKILNEISSGYLKILQQVSVDEPDVTITLVKSPIREKIEQEKTEVKEAINDLNSLPSLEDKIMYFAKKRFNQTLHREQIQNVIGQ